MLRTKKRHWRFLPRAQLPTVLRGGRRFAGPFCGDWPPLRWAFLWGLAAASLGLWFFMVFGIARFLLVGGLGVFPTLGLCLLGLCFLELFLVF